MDYENLRASDGTGDAVLAHITANRLVGATTLVVDSTDNWPDNFIVVTGTINAEGFISPSGMTQMRGHLSAGNIEIDSFEPGYTDVGNTDSEVAIVKMTTEWANNVVDLAKVTHNDDGTLKDEIVGPANLNASTRLGWLPLGATPSTVTNNGNRSYDLVFNSVDLTQELSEGMRLKLTRTVTAPTQSTSLNGSTQYWSKSSPAGTTFTDDFCAGAWITLTSYPATGAIIESRYNGTSGWRFFITSEGRVRLAGHNGGAANFSYVQSMQSVPLNKRVFVAAQLDMSAYTVSATQSYVMIDGVDVPAEVNRGGTNPTALVQAGNLEIGSENGGTNLFTGNIAQSFYTSAKLTQANQKLIYSQGLTTADTATYSMVSAFSFNGVATDLNTTNANNLTASNSAGYVSDSPFASGSRSYDTAGTTEYAVISTKPTFSTNTTVTVQVPEGCAIPTSGGISSVSYSTQSKPYGFPTDKDRWVVESIYKTVSTQSNPTAQQWYWTNTGQGQITKPAGSWEGEMQGAVYGEDTVASFLDPEVTLCTNNTSSTSNTGNLPDFTNRVGTVIDTSFTAVYMFRGTLPSLAQTIYYRKIRMVNATRDLVGSYASALGAEHIRLTPNFL